MKAISPQVLFFSAIILATILEVIADILLKVWSNNNNLYFFSWGLVIYFIGIVFWAVSLRYGYLSRAISIIVVLNLILVVLVGVFAFHEKLTALNKIGIGLGIISIFFLGI